MKAVLFILLIISTTLLFADTTCYWQVVDCGNGYSLLDLWVIRASIGQPLIGTGFYPEYGLSVGFIGGATIYPVEVEDKPQKPFAFGIRSIKPNPFNPTAEVEFEIDKRSDVKIDVYTILGQLVETPFDRRIDPGRYKMLWNGRDLPTGVYFLRLQSGEKSTSKRIVYLK